MGKGVNSTPVDRLGMFWKQTSGSFTLLDMHANEPT